MKMHMLTFTLLLIGGLNWLLVGLFGWDVGQLFGGQDAFVSRIIYMLVGLAAIWEVAMHKGNCKACCTNGTCVPTKPEEKPMQAPPPSA